MTIEKTELAPGLVIKGTYKKQEHTVLVLGDAESGWGFELDGATVYKSLSSAAKAAMGGGSVNGWRFFSIAGQEKVTRPAPERTPKAKAKGARTLQQIKRMRKQEGCAEGETKWFCSACMQGFCLATGETPDACPQGHPREVVDDLASPAGDKAEAAASA